MSPATEHFLPTHTYSTLVLAVADLWSRSPFGLCDVAALALYVSTGPAAIATAAQLLTTLIFCPLGHGVCRLMMQFIMRLFWCTTPFALPVRSPTLTSVAVQYRTVLVGAKLSPSRHFACLVRLKKGAGIGRRCRYDRSPIFITLVCACVWLCVWQFRVAH